MRRKYDAARFLQSVELLNRHFHRPAVTTDLITGFPGETEEEFRETLEFIQKCKFARMHIFPYSERPGTPAAEMEQVPKALRGERAHRAAELAQAMRRAYLEGCVGEVYEVLFEQPNREDGLFLGHAPNYTEVLVRGTDLHNQVRPVKITRTDGDALFGEWEE
jgi:threonylcarbamoyladenosine tRNA methylthiotransferase MtaB